MNLQTSINILHNRDWILAHSGSTCSIYTLDGQYLVLPLRSIGRVPSGTLDSLFRSRYTAKEAPRQKVNHASKPLSVLTVILEKQGSQIWGRIERQGSLTLTIGNTPEAVAKKLSSQLTEFTDFLAEQNDRTHPIPADFVFDYHYDLTRVRELFQQFRINALAEQTNIPQDLVSQFMTSKRYPTVQQAQQIEALIQQFGREMLNFTLL
jgi:hypothetical protein